MAALAAAAAALLPIADVAPWYLGSGSAGSGEAGPGTKLLVSNVYHGNREYERIQRLVAREDPDVVGLIEVDEGWLPHLGALRARYPHFYEVPEERFIGLGLYSRLPLERARTLHLQDSGIPAIAATLRTPDGDVEIILVHLSSPIDTKLIRRRNQQASALADHVRALGKPTVVVGDFNLTMWNRAYRPLEEVGGLRNARAGHGVMPTWPAVPSLGVPIDHVLATAPVRLDRLRVHAGIGSDHLPISAVIRLPGDR